MIPSLTRADSEQSATRRAAAPDCVSCGIINAEEWDVRFAAVAGRGRLRATRRSRWMGANPLHFRVLGVEPVAQPHREEVDLVIDPLTLPVRRYRASRATMLTYIAAIEHAITSGAVYWVDLPGTKHSRALLPGDDETLARMLRALKDRQLVQLEPGNGELQPE
jgi:hypothetical protein